MMYVCTEDEAMGINAGLYMTGHRPMLLIQNNGLYACVNTLKAIALDAQVPTFMLIGQFGRDVNKRVEDSPQPGRSPARADAHDLGRAVRTTRNPGRRSEDPPGVEHRLDREGPGRRDRRRTDMLKQEAIDLLVKHRNGAISVTTMQAAAPWHLAGQTSSMHVEASCAWAAPPRSRSDSRSAPRSTR